MHIASTEKCLCPANTPTPAQFFVQAPNSTELRGLCRYTTGRLVLPAAALDFSMVRVSLRREEFTLKMGSTPRASHLRGLRPKPDQHRGATGPTLSPQTPNSAGSWGRMGCTRAMAQSGQGHQPSPAATMSPGSNPGWIEHNHSHHKARWVQP